MPYDREINLDKDLTDEDIKQLEADADKIEKLAKEAQKDAQSLLDAEKKAEEAEKRIREKVGTTIKKVNRLTESQSPLGMIGGDVDFDDVELSGIFGGGSATGLPEKPKDQYGRAPAAYRSGPDYIAPRERTAMDIERMVEEKVNLVLQASGNIGQFVNGKLIRFAGATAIGAGILFGKEVFDEIVERIKKLFGPGGPFDLRKMVLEAAKEITNLNYLIKINSGQVFFTSDTSEILRQGTQVGFSTNLRNSLAGHKQYLQFRES